MNDLAERAQRNADQARTRIDRTQILRMWWSVTRPGGEHFELFVPDSMTQEDVIRRYPGCGVLPL